MQNSITSNGSASWAEHADDGAQSRNLAAIALAEAMHRARTTHHLEAQLASAPQVPTATPKSRLDALRKKLKPLYAAIPQDVEGIDLSVVREEKPRLFLDMIAFVDVAEDQKNFRLVKGGRNGPQVLHETADETALIARITDYIAERLIVRERLLEQGDPVVAGAAHFSRGVSAGLGVNPTSVETTLTPVASVASRPLEPKQSVTNNHEPVKAEGLISTQLEKATDEGIAPRKVFAQTSNLAQATLQPAATKSTASATSSVRSSTTLSPSVQSSVTSAWWLWPTLAMLIGMALAAYLLYVYARSLGT